jgi:succinyl-diaminopimelate desuccinylase
MQKHLEKLVNFYPVSSNQESVKALLEYAENIFDKAGLYTNLFEDGGVYNLFAAPQETNHVKILLQSHVDVVPAEDQPFRVAENKYYGRGTFDMLFAAASYLKFVEDNQEEISNLDFGIFLSGDEEVSGAHGVKQFLDMGFTSDICILPDAGTKLGLLNVAAKGIYNISVKINGQSHHGSRPWEGDGAAGKLVSFLAAVQQLFDNTEKEDSTLTIAVLSAGHADNQGPKEASATLDIRYKDKNDLNRIKKAVDSLLDKYDGKIVKELSGDDYQLDMTKTLVKSFIDLYKDVLRRPIETMKAPGSSDARYFSAQKIPVIMFRPQGHGAHGDNEWVSIEETQIFYNILSQYILKEGVH